MSTFINFADSTYFPIKTPPTLGDTSYFVGYDNTNSSYFKLHKNNLFVSLQKTGTAAELLSLSSNILTQKTVLASNTNAANTTHPLELSVDTSLKFNFDQTKLDGDKLKLDFAPTHYTYTEDLDDHLAGIDEVLGTLLDTNSTAIYDSGWKDAPSRVVNGGASYGTLEITNTPFDYSPLKYRVIGRQVFVRGTLYIPLAANPEGSPITNYETARTTNTNYVAVGYESGWYEETITEALGSQLSKTNTFNSDYLSPEVKHYLGEHKFRRYVHMQDEEDVIIPNQSGLLTSNCIIEFDENGDFKIRNDLGNSTRYGLAAQLVQSTWGTSIVRAGDYAYGALLFSTPTNSEDQLEGGMATSVANQWKNNNAFNKGYGNVYNTTPNYTSARYLVDFNGNIIAMGGFYVNVDFSYLVANTVTIAQIQSAVASN